MLIKKIKEIEFGFFSPEDVRKMSALEIKNSETYDKDGYPMEGGLMDPHLGVINPGLRCKTCGNKMRDCPGHFGHLELVRPVMHSEFGKKIEELLVSSCHSCGRVLLSEEDLQKIKEMDQSDVDQAKTIVKIGKKTTKCPHCGEAHEVVLLDKPTNFFLDKERLYPTQIRDWLEKIPEADLELFGYNSKRIKPEWFVLTVLQVPPIAIRPSITLETGIKSEDDLTHKLVDIVRINSRLKDNIDAGAPQLIIEDLWDLLQYHITTYLDNNTAGVPPAKHRSGRPLRTLIQRLKGKKGRFRYNLTGKRVNFAARSTITPDPYLSINELGVPSVIAASLTVPETITVANKKFYQDEIKKNNKVKYIIRPNGGRRKIIEEFRKEIAEELDIGYKVERELQNGDIVLFNRQPSLHRLSMMAHFVKILENKTLRLNPAVCKPYNADFDGDEMNMHVPQTEEGKVEARRLMLVENQITSPRHGGPLIILDEDGVSGTYVLTMKSTVFDKADAMQAIYELGFTELPKPDVGGKKYSGKSLFSMLLPKDLNLEYETKTHKLLKRSGIFDSKNPNKYDSILKIENGKLISGVIDSASLGEGGGKLIDILSKKYPSDIVREFYNKLGRLTGILITRKGMTAGLDEYISSDSVNKLKKKLVEKELEEADELVKKFKKGKLEIIPGRTLEESFELYIMRLGAKIKGELEINLLKEKTLKVLSEKPPYNTTIMILSGSRGKPSNLTNISGLWGQASVREGRPKRGYNKRLIPINKRGDIGAMAGGFIVQNFVEGLGGREFFYHSMGGRQGEVDTGVSTKVSGYLYRRLANSLKDLVVANDNTVRTASKNIVQFNYGDDGIFPINTSDGRSVKVEEIAKKLRKK